MKEVTCRGEFGLSEGDIATYIVMLDGEDVYTTTDHRDLFIAELKARIKIANEQPAKVNIEMEVKDLKRLIEKMADEVRAARRRYDWYSVEKLKAGVGKLEKKLSQIVKRIKPIEGCWPLAYTEETTCGKTPNRIIGAASNEFEMGGKKSAVEDTTPLIKPRTSLQGSARFDCPACGKGIWIEIDKTID